MPVQVEPETPVGMRVRMVPRGADPGLLPQGQGHSLSGVRPGRRCPHHQLQRRGARTPVTGQGDGQAGPEPSVGDDPGHVPAEQIRRQPTQIRTKAGDELGAVAVAHGAQIEIDVDPGGGAGPRPVTDRTPCGRGLDHGRRHGVLAHALPHQQVGRNRVREVMCHQHSPCANDSPDPYEELFFILRIISTAMRICQSPSTAHHPSSTHAATPGVARRVPPSPPATDRAEGNDQRPSPSTGRSPTSSVLSVSATRTCRPRRSGNCRLSASATAMGSTSTATPRVRGPVIRRFRPQGPRFVHAGEDQYARFGIGGEEPRREQLGGCAASQYPVESDALSDPRGRCFSRPLEFLDENALPGVGGADPVVVAAG